MAQTTFPTAHPTTRGHQRAGLHVAIIMDGNGRWAVTRRLPRVAGHCEGVKAVRSVVESAPALGVGVLTLYAFSSDNWRRPPDEVETLMRLFQEYLDAERRRFMEHGVRVNVIGRRDRLSTSLREAARSAEAATAGANRMQLRLAIDYSAREAILDAARCLNSLSEISQAEFSRLVTQDAFDASVSDVDLLIRTGGEQRLSDFLLWESAYAELFFTDRLWPDFTAADLSAAIREFRTRERRFGRISHAAAS